MLGRNCEIEIVLHAENALDNIETIWSGTERDLIMQSEPKYESLDMEQLLLHKSYYELGDDEREFALQHIDSEQEYEDLRKTLLNIEFSSESEELIAPPPRIKEELMAAFASVQGSDNYQLSC